MQASSQQLRFRDPRQGRIDIVPGRLRQGHRGEEQLGLALRLETPLVRLGAYLSHDQVHTLAALSAHPTLVLCLAYTGIRWGEATALRVRHINFLRRRLKVEENAVKVGSIIHLGTTKGRERRSVPSPELLSAGLA